MRMNTRNWPLLHGKRIVLTNFRYQFSPSLFVRKHDRGFVLLVAVLFPLCSIRSFVKRYQDGRVCFSKCKTQGTISDMEIEGTVTALSASTFDATTLCRFSYSGIATGEWVQVLNEQRDMNKVGPSNFETGCKNLL